MQKVFIRILAAFLSFLFGVFPFFGEKGEIEQADFKSCVDTFMLADTVYLLSGSGISYTERITMRSLQGVVAKHGAAIGVDVPERWLKVMREDYGVVFEQASDVWSLAARYADCFTDKGYVSFRFSRTEENYNPVKSSVNKACTISGVENYLVVGEEDEGKAINAGFTKKADAVTDYETEFDVFTAYRDRLNKNYIIQQAYDNCSLRDYGIAVGAVFMYPTDKNELIEVYQWLDECAFVLGWHVDEVSGVALASEYGLMTVASDHASNLSLYSALPETEFKQIAPDYGEAETDVHYVTFLLSDGDNLQWLVNSYADGFYDNRVRGNNAFGWSFPATAFELAPQAARYFYDNATENDCIFAGVSGIGYVNPALMPREALKTFTQLTADYFEKYDLHSVNILMDTSESKLLFPNVSNNSIYRIVNDYAEHESIDGGFLYYGWRYRPDHTPGAVFWSYGKPFIAIRETLWVGADEDKAQRLRDTAQRINAYSTDVTTSDAYSAICVHAWSYSFSEVQQLIEMFDENVRVVTPDRFVQLMTENIECKPLFDYSTGKARTLGCS